MSLKMRIPGGIYVETIIFIHNGKDDFDQEKWKVKDDQVLC